MANPLKRASCRSCGAAIIWCVNERGHRQPVDFDPVDGGNLRLVPNLIPNVRVQPDVEIWEDDGVRYIAHHATCPHADEWRAAYATH